MEEKRNQRITKQIVKIQAWWRMMRVRLNGSFMRAVGRLRAMAFEANHVSRLQQIGIVFRAVNIVATVAAHAMGVHRALNEIVALHAVLVRRAVGKMREGRLSELVILEFPEVVEVEADMKSDRPIVILPTDRVLERLPL